MGSVTRDEDRCILAAASWAIPPDLEAHEAEAMVCWMGLQFALDGCFMDIILESASIEAIQALSNFNIQDNYFGLLISNSLALLRFFQICSILTCEKRWQLCCT